MDDHIPHLREQARALPEVPGVYFWRDNRERVLYIGKAVNLRSRVTSYFSAARRDRRTRELLRCARSIRHEVCASELEALLRESALIKKHQPPYNRALRTSRPVYYLKLDAGMPDPYLEVVKDIEEDGSLYFGPFHSAGVVRETLSYLHDVLPLRKCTAKRPRCRPCLYYQMGTCAAPLLDSDHRRRHEEAIGQLHDLLDGRSDRVMTWLLEKRDRASEAMLFELAAEMQERVAALENLTARQAVLEAAARCRHLLIWDEGSPPRLLIVAKGLVLGVRPAADLSGDEVRRWVRAHEPLAKVARPEQSDLDSASVLGKWLRGRREMARWVAVPPGLSDVELDDRIRHVVRAGVPA
ncbi:MAG TPA: GIY-YIG nuclease family protein [Chloroflexota bacterium]|nr:GIY-YIG nuclease family protein [Chloroflexota bacterium]